MVGAPGERDELPGDLEKLGRGELAELRERVRQAIREAETQAEESTDADLRLRCVRLNLDHARVLACLRESKKAEEAIYDAIMHAEATAPEIDALHETGRWLSRALQQPLAEPLLRTASLGRSDDDGTDAQAARLRALASLGALLSRSRRGAEAEALLRDALEELPAALHADPAIAGALVPLERQLGEALFARGEALEAERRFERALAAAKRAGGPAARDVIAIEEALARLHAALAEARLSRALERVEALGPGAAAGEDAAARHRLRRALAAAAAGRERLDEAEALLLGALEGGGGAPDVGFGAEGAVRRPGAPNVELERARTTAALACVLYAEGRGAEAERRERDARGQAEAAFRRDLPPGLVAFFTRPSGDLGEAVVLGHALATPDEIRRWSRGAVEREGRRDDAGRPLPGGLLCERLFGPERDYACACGRLRGLVLLEGACPACGVEVAPALVRAHRVAHLPLPVPVVHPFCAAGAPGLLGALLDEPPDAIAAVLAFEAFVVVAPGPDLPHLGRVISAARAHELAGARADDARPRIATGPHGVAEALAAFDLAPPTEGAPRRMDVPRAFAAAGRRPSAMVLSVIPVLPPALAPSPALRFDRARLDAGYDELTRRIEALAALGPDPAAHRAAARALQAAADALFAAFA